MRSLILLACITWMSMSIVTSASSATTPETESFKAAALSTTMAPPASGYMDMWIRDSQGCEREAGPITFTPGECFYVPFLANFSSTYFTAPQQDGYAIVFYSSDNTTAFLYAYEDEQCQKYSNWSYSTPVATQQCANYTGPNIWPSEGSFGPSAPAWPADQFTAPIGMDYHTGTCDPYNMNGLSLGFCYGAGSASPSAVFCSAEEGTWVTFVQYASGSNCEPQNAIGTKLVKTGCNAVQQSDFTCPDVSGPTAPTIDYDSITLTQFIPDYSCQGAIVDTETYKLDVCVGNTMYSYNGYNATYWKYIYTGDGCKNLSMSQLYPVGCDARTSTFAQCIKSAVSDAASPSLFDSSERAPGKSDASPQIAEY